jgi:hypothetical protein
MLDQNIILLSDGGESVANGTAVEMAVSCGHQISILTYPGSGIGDLNPHCYELDIEHLKEANRYLMRANKSMHRSWPRRQLSADNALRRDSWTARWVHRVYVIGLFTQDASLLKINTDAAWPAQMYVDRFLYDQEPWKLCELFFFDMKSESWWTWTQQWHRVNAVPPPDGVYTILGQDKLTSAGKAALKALFINQL